MLYRTLHSICTVLNCCSQLHQLVLVVFVVALCATAYTRVMGWLLCSLWHAVHASTDRRALSCMPCLLFFTPGHACVWPAEGGQEDAAAAARGLQTGKGVTC
jgi:hypothetical protein